MPPRARTCKAAPQTAAVSDAPTLAAHIHRDLAPTCFEVCLGCERTSGAGWGVSAGRKAAVTKTDRTRSPRRARSRAAAAAAARPLPPPSASCSSQARTPVQTRLGTSARAGGEARLGAPAELRARGVAARVQRRGAAARLLLRLRVRVVLEGGVALARRGHGRARSAARNCGRHHSFIICTAGCSRLLG